jgi:hypothetical protein
MSWTVTVNPFKEYGDIRYIIVEVEGYHSFPSLVLRTEYKIEHPSTNPPLNPSASRHHSSASPE